MSAARDDGSRPQQGFLGRAGTRLVYRKNIDRLLEEARDEKKGLAKTLTAKDLVILGVAGIIGAGIFVLIGEGIGVAGAGVIPAFVVAALICAVAGFAYAELSSSIPASGSAYAYIYTVLGELPGWLVAWALVLEYAVGAIAVAVGWRNNLLALINQFKDSDPSTDVFSNPDRPWLYWFTHSPFETVTAINAAGLEETLRGVINVPSVLIVLLIALLLVRGTKESAKFTLVLVLVKVVILILAIVGGFLAFDAANFDDPFPHDLADDPNTEAMNDPVSADDKGGGMWGAIQMIFAGAAIMFFAYIGFDSVSTTAEETKNPKKDMPKGILGSLAITTVLYVLAAVALSSASHWSQYIGDSVAASNRRGEPFGYLFEENAFLQVGDFALAALLIRIGAIVGTTSVLIVLILGGVRVFFNMSRDGLLPPLLSRISKRGTPAVGTMFYGAFTAVFAALLTLGDAVNLVNIGTLFAFLMVILAVWVFRIRRPDVERPFRMPLWSARGVFGLIVIAALALAGALALLNIGLDPVGLIGGGLALAAVIAGLVYAWQKGGFLPVLTLLGMLGTIALIASLQFITIVMAVTWTGIGLVFYALYSIRNSREAHDRLGAPVGAEVPSMTMGVGTSYDMAPNPKGIGKADAATGRRGKRAAPASPSSAAGVTAGAYLHKGYTLYKRTVVNKDGSERSLYFFAKRTPKSGNPAPLPPGYEVGVNDRTGLPYLRKG